MILKIMSKITIVHWSFTQSVIKMFIGSLLLVNNAEDSKKHDYNVKRSMRGILLWNEIFDSNF